MTPLRRLAVAVLIAGGAPASAASFADLAALTLAAPVVIRATVVKADRLGKRDAVGVPSGAARTLVTATTTAAVVAPGEVPQRLTYLRDVPLDAAGKIPKLAGRDVLLFLRPDAVPGQYVLADAHGEVPWSTDADADVRGVVAAARSGSVPVVTGVASAFRVPGAVPGEAESQFFVSTAAGKPVSLVVLTRPGAARRVSIALGDVIDDAAAPIPPRTLLWYRLACTLPATLPPAVAADAAVADDWAFVRASLGPCGRTF